MSGVGSWERFYDALGIGDQLKREGFIFAPWRPEFDNNVLGLMSTERQQRFNELKREAIAGKTAAEWEQKLWYLSAATVCTREEFMAKASMVSSGVLATMTDGHSELTMPGRLCDISDPEGDIWLAFQEGLSITVTQAEELFSECTKLRALVEERP